MYYDKKLKTIYNAVECQANLLLFNEQLFERIFEKENVLRHNFDSMFKIVFTVIIFIIAYDAHKLFVKYFWKSLSMFCCQNKPLSSASFISMNASISFQQQH